MFMITIILVILAIGLLLTVLELFFIPGTTIVGILGVIFSIAGIAITYDQFGPEIGMYVLIVTSIAKVGVLYWSFHTGAWMRFSLKSAITSKVNEGITNGLVIGEQGITMTTLRPAGKAEFGQRILEVTTAGTYIENGSVVRIKSIDSNQITVEPTN